MTPYYDHAGIQIFHGDCREVLPGLADESIDLVLMDPPYGINHPTDHIARGRGRGRGRDRDRGWGKDYPPVYGDDTPFDPLPWLQWPCILWGANYYSSRLPNVSGWLSWDKRVWQGVGVNDQADGELAWTNCVKGVRIYRHLWNGYVRDSEQREGFHPTQKPVALMRWCLTLKGVPDGMVLDPYMGSGPVLIAAKELHRRAIGIEIDEQYCEIAATRLAQEVLQFA